VGAQAVRPLTRAADTASDARAQALTMCADLGQITLVDDVLLVVSELVTNALRHGSGQITLTLEVDGELVVVTVGDEGPGRPRVLDPVERGAEGGRGLALVAAVGQDWGVRPTADGGKVVWCVLAPPGADQAALSVG
jgi:anti-sigma regulatory factor (Ser/Thr protein kinase)